MKLDLDPEMSKRLAKRAEKREYESAQAYAKDILETVLIELEKIESLEQGSSERTFSGETDNKLDEDGDVNERLKDLGYLD